MAQVARTCEMHDNCVRFRHNHYKSVNNLGASPEALKNQTKTPQIQSRSELRGIRHNGNKQIAKEFAFCPRHDFFSLILGVAYSEIRPLCATLALVSGKRPALVQSSSRSSCAPVPNLSFIVNLGNGAFSLGASAFQTVLLHLPMLRRWAQSVYTFS